MSGGGGGSKEQTTTTEPWSGVKPYLKDLANMIGEQKGDIVGGDYTKDMAEMTPEQRTALESLQQYYGEGGGFQETLGQANGALSDLLRSPEEVAQSQEVQDLIASKQAGITEQLNEKVLPQIRSGATSAGQYGSTRQGVAEGVATGKAASSMADLEAQITGDVYNTQLQNQLKATGLAPSIASAGGSGLEQLFNIGDIERQENQAREDLDYWNRLYADQEGIREYANLLMPMAGLGGTTTTSVSGGGPNGFGKMLGAGLTGLGAYGSAGSAGLTGAAPWLGGGAALLSLLS